MRKYFLSMLAMAAMLLTVSCSKDAAVDSVANQSAVSFNISTPELTTRAVGDGETANKLYWAVYDEAGKLLPNISNTTKGEGKEFTLKTNVSITLVKGKKYSFIFWAENQDGMCTIDWANQSMTINPALANQEAYDAFWAYHKLENPVSGTINEDIFLYRPFAQLNIGTSDKAAAADAGMAVAKSQVIVATPATLDLVSGVTTGSVLCSYKFENIATIEAEDFPVDGYSYLAMNYLLVDKSEKTNPQENTIIPDLKFEYQDADGKTYEQVYYNIPVKRNYKTNIYGTLLTNEANFKVEIKPEFDGENLERWDGIEKVEPEVVDGAYRVATAAQFAWILENCKENINIVMDASIDFGGKQVPMNEYTDNGKVINGTYRNITIEGNGNTIYNFVDEYTQTRAAGDARIAGLFPNAITATVHDLTISGAKVNAGAGESAYAGVLFGRTYGDIELKGVNIENCSVAGTNKVGGLVGFVAENTIYAYNCHVKNTNVSTNDFTSSEGEEAGLAGGLIGYIASGENEITECTVEGGKFTVKNSRNNKDRANSKFIGGIGSATVNIEGCTVNVADYNETTTYFYNELVGCIRFNGSFSVNGKKFFYKNSALTELEADMADGEINMTKDLNIISNEPNAMPALEVFGDLTINGNGNDMDAGSAANYGLIVRGGTTVVNDTNIKSQGGAVGVIGGAEVIFNSGSAYVDTASTSGRYLFYLEGEGSTVTINDGDFSWDPADNQKRAYIYAGAGTTAYVKGGNFGKASTRSGYTAGILGDGTVIITGGSFGFDPSAWVADGYTTIKKDGKYYVVAEGTVVIASEADFYAAFEKNEKGNIILTKDVLLTDDITVDNMMKIEDGANVCFDLNGKTLEFERDALFVPGNPIFYPLAGTKLTITGNGTIDLGDNFDAALIFPAGEVVIENGTFIRNRVPEGTSPDDVQTMFVGVKTVGSKMVINGGYFDSGYYDKNAELEFSETDADVANRGKAADKNLIRTAIKNNTSFAFNLSWSSEAGTQDFKIYGGTFVNANPAWGDEGCAMPITPNYLRPWSYYQGTFLEGQEMHDDRIEIPTTYTITESKTADGRPVYTVNHNK